MWPCERAAARRARAAEWFERSRSPRQAITCLPGEAAGAQARGDCDAGPHAYSSPVADRAIAFYGALLDARLVLDVRAAEIGTPGAHDVIPLEKADDATSCRHTWASASSNQSRKNNSRPRCG